MQGEELPSENYVQIMEEVLPKRAKLRAMNLLMKRTYTSSQLRRKLEEGYYPPSVIEEALDYVASFHYTDDLQYALDYITYRETTHSRKRMEQDLMKRGISADLFEKAWSLWEDQGGSQDESAMIHMLLRKKGYKPEGADRAQQSKMYQFLLRKGFSGEQITKALRIYSEDA
ncbi:MAG: RecX family transcriptional regulator [Lachnospiraceae bacterium]|nr:RecX family transcriptional regulator [Lachnospiraceae bacterium]